MSRREEILSLVQARGGASVRELSLALGVSEPTVRRELRQLASDALVVRTYGGALAVHAGEQGSGTTASGQGTLDVKRRIGRAAAALVGEGETVVVGSGTTALEVARALGERTRLTVITNALDVAWLLMNRTAIDVIVLGGAVRSEVRSLVGHLTDFAASELRADVLFMGISAFDTEHGLTSDHMPEILTDRALRRIANKVVLVAESCKYRRVAPARVFDLSEVATLVTDADLPDDAREAIERLGVEVRIADRETYGEPTQR